LSVIFFPLILSLLLGRKSTQIWSEIGWSTGSKECRSPQLLKRWTAKFWS
jgi:hypothetical protein